MQKNIEIPDYKPILPNTVWIRDTEVQVLQDEVKVKGAQMLIIAKYTAPSLEETLDLIQKVAREYNPNSTISQGEEKGERPLAEFAQMLPKEFLEQIANGEDNAINNLIEHHQTDDHCAGRTYIQMHVGITTAKSIKAVKDLAKQYGARTYEGVWQTASTQQWTLRIMLDSDQVPLPDKKEMQLLLQSRVRDSDVLRVQGDYGNYNNIIEHVDLMYKALSNKSKIELLRDKTTNTLRLKAALTMQNTAQCLMAQQMGGLVMILGPNLQQQEPEELEEDDKKYDEDKGGSDYLPDFSKN